MAFSSKRMGAELRVYARSNLRSREGFFFTLVFPIILILLFGAIFSGGGVSQVNVSAQNLHISTTLPYPITLPNGTALPKGTTFNW